MPHALEKELAAAISAVRCAAKVCRAVAKQLVTAQTLEKKDRSPVTVADYASQAVVCHLLSKSLGDPRIMAEEDSQTLRQNDQAAIRQAVVDHAAAGLGQQATEQQVLGWIDQGGYGKSQDTPPPPDAAFWTLDPIDGTKGFLRGEQYAVALALIEQGKPVLGVLGCPNLTDNNTEGILLTAAVGQGTRVMSLWDDAKPGWPARVTTVSDPAKARFCESVESGHSSHSDAEQIAQRLGITADSLRMDSQAKYAAVAMGHASIYLRLPTSKDYQENIWDHAAGSIVVTEAGGRVTDTNGKPLDFSHGRTLKTNRGIVATNGPIHDHVVDAVGQVLSA